MPTSFVQSLSLAGHGQLGGGGWHEGSAEELKAPVSDRIDTEQTGGLSLSPAAWHLSGTVGFRRSVKAKGRGFQASWDSQACLVPALGPGTAKGRVRSGGTGCSARGQTESRPNYLSLTLLVLILAAWEVWMHKCFPCTPL